MATDAVPPRSEPPKPTPAPAKLATPTAAMVRFATAEQAAVIGADLRALGFTGTQARHWLHAFYGAVDPKLLTVAKANEAIKALALMRWNHGQGQPR